MVQLAKLGFSKNVITETIVSTYNIDGQPNAAPMGAIMDDARNIFIRPYQSTQTSKNLLSRKCAVINITSNPEFFYHTTFKETNPEGNLPSEMFQKAEIVDAPRIRLIDAFIEVEVTGIRHFENQRIEVSCQVKRIRAKRLLPKVYCRALHAVIESIVHATRVEVLISDKSEQKRVQNLLNMIDENSSLVRRVAPNSIYSQIMDDLNKRIQLWRSNSENPH